MVELIGGGTADLGFVAMSDLYEPHDAGDGLVARTGWLNGMEVLWTIGQLLLEGGWCNDDTNNQDIFERGGSKLMIAMSSLYTQNDLP
eukprot:6945682-Pyramimonas_sp.AAC.1